MDVYKLIREGERRALKAYFSGEPLDQICRRFGYSRVRLQAMAEDYKSGKIDIFGPMDKKRIDNQLQEVDRLKARVAELEEACTVISKGVTIVLFYSSILMDLHLDSFRIVWSEKDIG